MTFVPGIGNDASFWAAQAEALADRFRVVRFEPYGCGASPAPPAELRIEDLADDLVALWDSLGIETSSVVGLGFGGSTALVTGLRHPARVDKVVACCCRPRQPENRRDFWRERQAYARTHGLQDLTTQTVDRWLSADFRRDHPGVDAALRVAMLRNSVEGYVAYVGAFIEMDFAEDLPGLKPDTLLIAAEHDHGGGPVPAMQAMAERTPAARLTIVQGSGHIVNHEQPGEVTRLLREFLAA